MKAVIEKVVSIKVASMKKLVLSVSIQLLLISTAWADILVVSNIAQDRSEVEVTYINQRPKDMFCPEVHVRLEYCDSYYCDVVGETLSTIDSLYVRASGEVSFKVGGSADRIRQHYPKAIINRVKDLNTAECRVASFKDYCRYADHSVEEQRTLDKILESLRYESCDVESKDLKYININGSQIRELTPFSYIEQLENLNLANNEIEDLSPLYKLTKLWSVIVDNNPITDLEGLLNNKLITRVSAKNIPLKGAIYSPHSPSLKYLDLGSQGPICNETKAYFEGQQSSVKVICN